MNDTTTGTLFYNARQGYRVRLPGAPDRAMTREEALRLCGAPAVALAGIFGAAAFRIGDGAGA